MESEISLQSLSMLEPKLANLEASFTNSSKFESLSSMSSLCFVFEDDLEAGFLGTEILNVSLGRKTSDLPAVVKSESDESETADDIVDTAEFEDTIDSDNTGLYGCFLAR